MTTTQNKPTEYEATLHKNTHDEVVTFFATDLELAQHKALQRHGINRQLGVWSRDGKRWHFVPVNAFFTVTLRERA